jgi:hypothetical protein
MSSSENSRTQEPERLDRGRDYEPPCLQVLGTVEELTMGGGAGPTDNTVAIGTISDRRLKVDLRRVDASVVLDHVSG